MSNQLMKMVEFKHCSLLGKHSSYWRLQVFSCFFFLRWSWWIEPVILFQTAPLLLHKSVRHELFTQKWHLNTSPDCLVLHLVGKEELNEMTPKFEELCKWIHETNEAIEQQNSNQYQEIGEDHPMNLSNIRCLACIEEIAHPGYLLWFRLMNS